MKISVFAALLACSFAVLGITASAASYTDDMTGAASDGVKQYSGFIPRVFIGNAAALPDSTALTFASMAGQSVSARVDYRAEGAETVTAAIYSHRGTFASRNPSDSQVYLGVFKDDMSFLAGQTLTQARLLPGTNEVYADIGGWKKLYNIWDSYVFRDAEAPAGLTGYGIRILSSNDGQNFSPADLRHTELNFSAQAVGFCYERYMASVPSGTKYIRVEINDITSVPMESGGFAPKGTGQSWYTALASVTISGASLVMGEQEEPVQLFLPRYYWSEEAGTESRTTEYEGASDIPEEDVEPELISSPSSKFEGTITVSQKSSSEKEKPPSTEPERKPEPRQSASSEVSIKETRDDTVVYEIRRGEKDSRLDGAVTVYIIGASGALVLMVLLKPR